MEIKTKYITVDRFTSDFGIDLSARLNDTGNPSNTAESFLKRIEDRIAMFLDAYYFRLIDQEYKEFSDYQKEHYSLALLYQAKYQFDNGDIFGDSGYDFEKGEIMSNELREAKWLSPDAKGHLMLCGLLTRKFQKRRGGVWFI